jgi:hypothetical protein
VVEEDVVGVDASVDVLTNVLLVLAVKVNFLGGKLLEEVEPLVKGIRKLKAKVDRSQWTLNNDLNQVKKSVKPSSMVLVKLCPTFWSHLG